MFSKFHSIQTVILGKWRTKELGEWCISLEPSIQDHSSFAGWIYWKNSLRNDKYSIINQFCSGYLPGTCCLLRAKGHETGGKRAHDHQIVHTRKHKASQHKIPKSFAEEVLDKSCTPLRTNICPTIKGTFESIVVLFLQVGYVSFYCWSTFFHSTLVTFGANVRSFWWPRDVKVSCNVGCTECCFSAMKRSVVRSGIVQLNGSVKGINSLQQPPTKNEQLAPESPLWDWDGVLSFWHGPFWGLTFLTFWGCNSSHLKRCHQPQKENNDNDANCEFEGSVSTFNSANS